MKKETVYSPHLLVRGPEADIQFFSVLNVQAQLFTGWQRPDALPCGSQASLHMGNSWRALKNTKCSCLPRHHPQDTMMLQAEGEAWALEWEAPGTKEQKFGRQVHVKKSSLVLLPRESEPTWLKWQLFHPKVFESSRCMLYMLDQFENGLTTWSISYTFNNEMYSVNRDKIFKHDF